MNKKLIDVVKKVGALKEDKAREVLGALKDTVLKEVEENGEFKIIGFGTFKNKETEARKQKIGEKTYKIPARTTVRFKASKNLTKIKK